jgi:hypothetical protein
MKIPERFYLRFTPEGPKALAYTISSEEAAFEVQLDKTKYRLKGRYTGHQNYMGEPCEDRYLLCELLNAKEIPHYILEESTEAIDLEYFPFFLDYLVDMSCMNKSPFQ